MDLPPPQENDSPLFNCRLTEANRNEIMMFVSAISLQLNKGLSFSSEGEAGGGEVQNKPGVINLQTKDSEELG